MLCLSLCLLSKRQHRDGQFIGCSKCLKSTIKFRRLHLNALLQPKTGHALAISPAQIELGQLANEAASNAFFYLYQSRRPANTQRSQRAALAVFAQFMRSNGISLTSFTVISLSRVVCAGSRLMRPVLPGNKTKALFPADSLTRLKTDNAN